MSDGIAPKHRVAPRHRRAAYGRAVRANQAPPAPAVVPVLVPAPTTYPNLPTPAPRGQGCTSCRSRPAIIVRGTAAVCLTCWTDHLQTEGAADARP